MPFTEPEILGLGAFPLGATAMGAYAFSEIETIERADGVRFLDASVGDYAKRDGKILRTSATKQRVINLLAHRFATSISVRGVRAPEVHDAYTERYMDGEVRNALRPVVNDGSIQITKVSTKLNPQRVGRLGVSVEFIDTQTGEPDLAEV